MGSLSKAWVTPVSILIVVLSGMASAWGQSTTESFQTLDRVDSVSRTAVLEMAFGEPIRPPDFTNLDITALTGYSACQLTPIKGLFCLDGRLIRHWADPAQDPSDVSTEFSCADRALGLDTKKPDTCTSMTVDLAGNIWIAGKKANSHSLIKVVQKIDSNCPEGSTLQGLTAPASDDPNYCFRVYATGRPLLLDIASIDGDVGADFNLGSGMLGLEERKTAIFFGDSPTDTPIVIASGKSGWNLIGSEQLLSAAVFQLGSDGSVANYVLATTTTGRILAKNTASSAAAVQVFNVPAARVLPPGLGQCDASTQQYGIRASTKSGIVYVTDRNFCQVIALQPTGTPLTPLAALPPLENVLEGSANLTLSTESDIGSFAPDAPTIAPGISIDLRDCGENEPSCVLLTDATGATAAQLTGVILDTGPSGMTLFQIKGIPDCRDLPTNSFCLEKIAEEGQGGQQVIVGPAGNRSAQYLNVTPLLPEEIKAVLAASGESPPMLISPLYRGQAPDFIFEGFFGVTDPATQFRETFTGEFDVALLTGEDDLGCGGAGPQPNLNWDVVTMVSERYSSVGGPTGDVVGADKEHADMLANSDCFNPTVPRGVRWSLYSYNLEVAPNGDSVFARVLDSIYNDLESTRAQLACVNVDAGGDVAPLASGICGTLADRWGNGRTKLDECILASNSPKQSEAVRNCNAFATQLENYQTTLDGAARTGIDPANRIGELKARVAVIFHVLEDHFLPSVPPGGFIDPYVPGGFTAP